MTEDDLKARIDKAAAESSGALYQFVEEIVPLWPMSQAQFAEVATPAIAAAISQKAIPIAKMIGEAQGLLMAIRATLRKQHAVPAEKVLQAILELIDEQAKAAGIEEGA